MKRIFLIPFVSLFLFCSCAKGSGDSEIPELYRSLNSARYTVAITANFPSHEHVSTIDFTYENGGIFKASVIEPKEIEGITLTVKNGEGTLSFDGAHLETGELDSEGFSPFSSLPALMTSWKEGNFREVQTAKMFGKSSVLAISEHGNYEYRTWFTTDEHLPVYAEIFSDGSRIIQCKFERTEHN